MSGRLGIENMLGRLVKFAKIDAGKRNVVLYCD